MSLTLGLTAELRATENQKMTPTSQTADADANTIVSLFRSARESAALEEREACEKIIAGQICCSHQSPAASLIARCVYCDRLHCALEKIKARTKGT
jgi:hypothetical protein